MFLQRINEGGTDMKEEQKKQIKEIVQNMQQMTRESLLVMKSAAEVLKIRDSMEKKVG